jgi:hypothetical protein
VDADPHAQLDACGPLVGAQRALCLGGGLRGRAGAREDVEEGVALRLDLFAAVSCECLAEDAPMLGQRLAVALAQLREQPRRAFDVREQEGNGAALNVSRTASPSPRREHRAPSCVASSGAAVGVIFESGS